MPSSSFNHIPLICHLVCGLNPRSILDVGVGFGKWGHLFRELTDIAAAGDDPPRYRRENWQFRIDGIEAFEPYLTEMHRFLYDNIHVGDMLEVLPKLGKYDVIFMGDVIEHIELDRGKAFLREALDHAGKAVIVTTPAYELVQEATCGNEYERHRSLWTAADFREFPRCWMKVVQSKIRVALLLKEGVPMPPRPSRLKSFVRATLIRLLGYRRYKGLGLP